MSGLALPRGANARQLIDRVEYAIRRCGAADDALAAEIIPNLSVMLARLLEQSGGTPGNILHGDIRHGAAKLGKGLLFEVEAPRVFWREMRLDSQRGRDFA